jgi:opacity protein-like surface antigen
MMFLANCLPDLRRFRGVAALAAGLLAAAAQAQVAPSAWEPAHSFWVGGEYSNIHAGFPYQSDQRLWGVGGFADYSLKHRLGIAGEARFLHFNSFYGENEDSYLAGPRYAFRDFGNFELYAKGLVGLGRMQYPFEIGSKTYLDLAPGVGVSYRMGHRWQLRGEYEYQFWLNSPGFANEPEHQITPNGFHIGVAFRPLPPR